MLGYVCTVFFCLYANVKHLFLVTVSVSFCLGRGLVGYTNCVMLICIRAPHAFSNCKAGNSMSTYLSYSLQNVVMFLLALWRSFCCWIYFHRIYSTTPALLQDGSFLFFISKNICLASVSHLNLFILLYDLFHYNEWRPFITF